MTPRQRIGAVPAVSLPFWSFAITGRVRHAAVWSYEDVCSLQHVQSTACVACSVAMAGAHPVRVSTWRGVPLSRLIAAVALESDAHFARIHGADGYTTIVPVEALDSAMLALECDGAPLTPEDGYPARLILPAHSGYKQAKWVERIEFVHRPVGGFWEARGYDVDGLLSPGTSLSVVAHSGVVGLSGVAFARGDLAGVQINIDQGQWMPAQCDSVTRTSDGLCIAQWQRVWYPPHTGTYNIQLRIEVQPGIFSRTIMKSIRHP